MSLTEEQIRALLACTGFDDQPAEPDGSRGEHLLQCDCDACLNGTPEEIDR